MRLKYNGNQKAIKIDYATGSSKWVLWMPIVKGSVIECPDEPATRLMKKTDEKGLPLFTPTTENVTVVAKFQ